MRTPIAIVVLALLALATSPLAAAERACRPSLSNFYNCPDTSTPATKSTQKTTKSDRACTPSLSNGYSCPTASTEGRRSAPPKKKTASATERECRPSLSNGFSCPNTAPSKNTTSTPERGCRPSLSNGFNCEGQLGANQYTTETLARIHCPFDTVVWANTRSRIYHFRATDDYGNTKAGAYMCEQTALAEGIRAAKNEKHP